MSKLEKRVSQLEYQLRVTSDPIAKAVVRVWLADATSKLRSLMLASLAAELSRA